MVRVCEEYSNLWRFSYNPTKSRVLQFHGQMRKLPLPVFCIQLYGCDIEVVESCTVVIITPNARHSAGDCVKQSANKLFHVSC